jgi:hypothetical protein
MAWTELCIVVCKNSVVHQGKCRENWRDNVIDRSWLTFSMFISFRPCASKKWKHRNDLTRTCGCSSAGKCFDQKTMMERRHTQLCMTEESPQIKASILYELIPSMSDSFMIFSRSVRLQRLLRLEKVQDTTLIVSDWPNPTNRELSFVFFKPGLSDSLATSSQSLGGVRRTKIFQNRWIFFGWPTFCTQMEPNNLLHCQWVRREGFKKSKELVSMLIRRGQRRVRRIKDSEPNKASRYGRNWLWRLRQHRERQEKLQLYPSKEEVSEDARLNGVMFNKSELWSSSQQALGATNFVR